MDLVSIIVPVYNSKDYLEQCIDSLLGQTYKNIEVILINDGSTDESASICKLYKSKDKRIVIIEQENAGAAVARNKGIDNANGTWISFCDSDDIISPFYIEKMYSEALISGSDIVSCGYTSDGRFLQLKSKVEKENGSGSDRVIEGINEHSYIYTGAMALEQNMVRQTLWGKLYKKTVFDGIRIPILSVHEDVAVIYRLYYKSSRVAVLPDVLYYNRIRQGSLSAHGAKLGVQLERLPVLREKIAFFKDNEQTVLYQMAVKEYVINILMFSEQARREKNEILVRKLKQDYDVVYPEIIQMTGSRAFHFSLRAAKLNPIFWTLLNRFRKQR